MQIIAEAGSKGVVLYLKREQGTEMFEPRGDCQRRRREPLDAKPSTMSSGRLKGVPRYGIGAQILRDLGVGKIRLISNYRSPSGEPAGLRSRVVRDRPART